MADKETTEKKCIGCGTTEHLKESDGILCSECWARENEEPNSNDDE